MKNCLVSLSCLAVLLILLSAASGCSPNGSGTSSSDYPPPGEVRVISVTPMVPQQSSSRSLIANGTFEDWHAGAPVPSGPYQAPGQASAIKRVQREDGGKALSQRWTRTDSKWNLEGRFVVGLANLKSETDYHLALEAKLVSGKPVSFELHSLDDEGTQYPVCQSLFLAEADKGWQQFATTFSSGIPKQAVLVTGCFEMPSEGKQELQIDNLVLKEVGPTEERPLPHEPEDNLIANGHFNVWLTGKELPEGPFVPPAASAGKSVITRRVAGTPEDPYKYLILQTWKENDSADDPKDLMGVVVDVEADTDYTLVCALNTRNRYQVAVSVFGQAADGSFAPIRKPLFEVVEKKDHGRYTNPFNSGSFTRIKIAAHVPSSTESFPNEPIWYYWILTETPQG